MGSQKDDAATEKEQSKHPRKKRIKKDKILDPKFEPFKNPESKPKKKVRRRPYFSINVRDQPRTTEMIMEAIQNLSDSNGSSVQAIKAYILENYKVNEDRFKTMMKKALNDLAKDNMIARPKGQAETKQVLCGRYLMGPKNKAERDSKPPRPPSLRQFKTIKTLSKKRKTRKRY